MPSYDFKNHYKYQNRIYEKYIEKSKRLRFFVKYGGYSLLLSLATMFLMATFEIPTVAMNEYFKIPTHLKWIYYINTIGQLSLIFGLAAWGISTPLLSRVKKQFKHNNIKIDFIYMYRTLESYEKYIENSIVAHKDDALKYLNKSYNFISDWEYDVPLIDDNSVKALDILKNRSKNSIKKLINSTKAEGKFKAYNIINTFTEFLLYGKYSDLMNLYNQILEFEKPLKMDLFINIKIKIKDNITNHPLRSQIIFTSGLLIFIYLIETWAKLNIQQIIPTLLTAFLMSFGIFDTLRKYILKLE